MEVERILSTKIGERIVEKELGKGAPEERVEVREVGEGERESQGKRRGAGRVRSPRGVGLGGGAGRPGEEEGWSPTNYTSYSRRVRSRRSRS